MLVGFSYTGKSQVGQLVAQYLGWQCVDTDQLIAQKYNKPISNIFSDDGEVAFRQLEKITLKDACSSESTVVCTGGGAILDADNRQLIMKNSLVVCLEALPETIYDRLTTSKSGKTREIRPVLEGANTLSQIRRLKTQRQIFYAQSHWTIHTDNLTISETALEVIRAWHLIKTKNTYKTNDPSLVTIVPHSTGIYPIFVGPGILDDIGKRLVELGVGKQAYIITDENTFHPYARKTQTILQREGIRAHIYSIPPGEGSKTLEMAQHIYRWLISHKAERKNAVLAIGGGVVGDLAGYVAATFLRGMPFIQVPTSLTSMVDASIGGKVAINLPDGKNLIGAFYQPSIVLADTSSLSTLGEREVNEGWAEAIKHGLILDKNLFELFEDKADDLINLEETITTKIIRHSMKIKAHIVAEDERETLDRRILLNYGHTIGHALETVTKYNNLLHGEAVSIGMMGAAIISCSMNILEKSSVERQQTILRKFSLPTQAGGISPEKIVYSMLRDKKMDSGALKWVLLREIGGAIVKRNVPDNIVNHALETITS